MKVYHFTSGINWESIQNIGSLEPYSAPDIPLLHLPANPYTPSQMEKIDRIRTSNPQYYNGKFIVTVPKSGFNAWQEYGLLNRVIRRCKDGITNKVFLLSFLVNGDAGAYMIEQAHFSPKRFMELCGRDLSAFVAQISDYQKGDIERLLHQFELCADSVVSLDQYDGSYKVPELWAPHPVPIDKLKVEKQFNFWDYFRLRPKMK